jgi:hypothetical protein
MGRRRKYHQYTDDQLKELATLSSQKELRRFSRETKHSYSSVYAYWRKATGGKKLTEVDPSVKLGKPKGSKHYRTARKNSVMTTVFETENNTIYVPIKSIAIANAADGTQQLVITY